MYTPYNHAPCHFTQSHKAIFYTDYRPLPLPKNPLWTRSVPRTGLLGLARVWVRGLNKLVNMVLNIHRNHKAYQGRGEGRWGEREIIYPSLHCHHLNDFCIKMGSDESHFNVSVGSDGQSHKTVSTNHNLFEEKGEPKRYRTEVLPLTSLTPYR